MIKNMPSNADLKKLLKNQNNIPVLEDLIGQKYLEFSITDSDLKGKPDIISSKDLKQVLLNVAPVINDFFGIDKRKMPKIRQTNINPGISTASMIFTSSLAVLIGSTYYGTKIMPIIEDSLGNYSSWLHHIYVTSCGIIGQIASQTLVPFKNSYFRGQLNIAPASKSETEAICAHEYTHYLINKNKYLKCCFKTAFGEGIARAAEREILRKNNEIAEFSEHNPYENSIAELIVAYEWTCKKNDILPQWSLNYPMGRHSLGNAVFSLYEYTRGTEIFKDIFAGTFDYPEIV